MDRANSRRGVRVKQATAWRVPSRRPPSIPRSSILPGLRSDLLPPLAPGECEPETVAQVAKRAAAWVRAMSRAGEWGPGGYRVTDGDGEGGVAPAPEARALPRLPCHESHNCDRKARSDRLTGGEIRAAESLAGNVAHLAEVCGLERVGMFTITLGDKLSYYNPADWKEAQRRLHNWLRKGLPEVFGASARWLSVVEPQHVRGVIHWHFLIECPDDIRTGFDWKAANGGRWKETGASPTLRRMWSKLRRSLPRYGLGRHELLPVRSSAEAIASYVGKYIGKTIAQESWHEHADGLRRPPKARRIRYSLGWRAWTPQYMSVEAGRKWRVALRAIAAECGAGEDFGFFRRTFGPRWAYHLRDVILPPGAVETAQPEAKHDATRCFTCEACGVRFEAADVGGRCPLCGERMGQPEGFEDGSDWCGFGVGGGLRDPVGGHDLDPCHDSGGG